MPDTRSKKPIMKLLGIEQLICQYDSHWDRTSKKKLHQFEEQKQQRYGSLLEMATSKKPIKTITSSKPQMSNEFVNKIYTNKSFQLTQAHQSIEHSQTAKKHSRNSSKHQESKGKIMSSLSNFSSKKGLQRNESNRKTSIKNGKDSECVGSASQAVIKQSIQYNTNVEKSKIQCKDQSMYLSYLSLKSRKIQAQKLAIPNSKDIDIQSATLAGINKKIRQFQRRGFKKDETVLFRKSVKPQCTQEWQKTPQQIKTVRLTETVRVKKQPQEVQIQPEVLQQQKQFVSIDTTYYGFSFKNKVSVVKNITKEESGKEVGSTLDKSTQQKLTTHPVDIITKKVSSSTAKIQPAKKIFSSLTVEPKKTRYQSTTLIKSKKPNSSLLLKPKLLLKDRYKLTKIIGRGMSGEVYQAQDILSDRYVVIKQIDVNSIEYEFFREITHQNVIRYYNNFVQNGKRYLVLQYFPMTLKDLIKEGKRNVTLQEHQIKHIFKSIIDGLSYLHSLSIAHRDIKLDNIVVSEDLTQVKFIDFGLCMDLGKIEHGLSSEFCGTLSYLPPQIARGQPHEPKKADIWSLGILFYAIAVGRLPFKGRNQSEVLAKICKGKVVFPQNINPSLKELIESMLEKDPKKRYTVSQVMCHEWMH